MSQILFELGCEELPPKALNNLAKSLYEGVVSELDKAKIAINKENSRWFASPRRLAFILNDVDEAQADRVIQRKGPAVVAAFDDEGQAKPAALGFAKSVQAEVSDLGRLKTDKGEWLVYDIHEKGQKTNQLIKDYIQTSIQKLPIPKPMRWGDNDFSFIRPVHWIILMEDETVIPFNMFGIDSNNKTRGHRFHAPDFIQIDSASSYVQQLLDVRVEVDQISRKQNVKNQVIQLAEDNNAIARTDDDLLDEVTAIVEYPVATIGHFSEDFLNVPAEALISSMQKHQKYFPVFDQDANLMPHFIALANIESKDVAQVVKGFEKVITPRLADARFFWEQDQKETLQSKFSILEKMTFEKQLGSLGDKCRRIDKVMKFLAEKMDLKTLQASRAAFLCKCDLVTDMVDEFPDLQGIMGGYYSESQGEPEEVAHAISQQYKPGFAGDDIPTQALAQALSIADKIDTLCGIFAVGKKPTGNKDPFALRRASIGIIRILQEGKIPVSIYELIENAVSHISLDNLDKQACIKDIENFIEQRLKHNYLEQDISFDVVDSVLAMKPANLSDCDQRILACQNFKSDLAAPALAAANKRISNILKKSIEFIPESVNLRVLKIDQEKNLYGAIESIKRRFNIEVESQEYVAAFKHLASLAEPVDAFFDNVMVNDLDEEIRLNRLAILQQLNQMFSAIADISKLEIV